MAEVIWTHSALSDLNEIAHYISDIEARQCKDSDRRGNPPTHGLNTSNIGTKNLLPYSPINFISDGRRKSLLAHESLDCLLPQLYLKLTDCHLSNVPT
jgi:plasmid stabilization system protein ParE